MLKNKNHPARRSFRALYLKRIAGIDLRFALYMAVFYLLLALLFTFPLVFHLNARAAGDMEGDMWKHLWGFWHVPGVIFSQGVFPLFTSLLNYPYGGGLFFIDPLGGLFAAPLRLLFPPALTYNLLLIFNLIFGAFAAYLLAEHFVKNRWAALVSGAIYAFSSYMLANITSGISETFNIGWLPLFMLFFTKALGRNGGKWVIPASLAFFATALGSWYYGIMAVLTGVFYLIYKAVFTRYFRPCKSKAERTFTGGFRNNKGQDELYELFSKASKKKARIRLNPEKPKEEPAGSGPVHRGLLISGVVIILAGILLCYRSGRMGIPSGQAIFYWLLFLLPLSGALLTALRLQAPPSGEASAVVLIKKLALMGVLIVLTVGPAFYGFKSTLSESGSMVRRERTGEEMRYYLSESFHNVSALADFIRPGKDTSRRTYTVDRLTRASYCGYITLFLCMSSLFFVRRRGAGFWLFTAAFFTIFSLGPFLYLDRGRGLSEPFFLYKWFYLYFPFFSQVSIPYRFNLPAMLGFAILGGYALAGAFKALNARNSKYISLALSMAVVFEIAVLSPAPYPIPLSGLKAPAFYHELAGNREEFGILDLPLQRNKGELVPGEYFYYQTIHKKGIPYTVEGTIPLYVYQNQFTLELYRQETGQQNPACRLDVLKQYYRQLKLMNFRYIIVHDNYLSEGQQVRIHAFLNRFMEKPHDGGMGTKIYVIR